MLRVIFTPLSNRFVYDFVTNLHHRKFVMFDSFVIFCEILLNIIIYIYIRDIK